MNVEIVGRACVAPGAGNPQQLFDLLRDRRCSVTRVPLDRWDHARYWHPKTGVAGKTYTFAAGVLDDIYAFDPTVFGMSQREAQFLDPQQRLMLELTWRALEDANMDHAAIRGREIGVYVGASSLDHANLVVEDPAAAGPYFMSGNTLSVVSNRVSHVFGLRGPSMTVDTACSSSLVALDQAVKALRAGQIDTAIVGGVSILAHPLAFVGFAQARMLSPDGLCKAYDDSGIGYVRAEGGAVFVLKRADAVQRDGDRSHATIVASGVNAAGRTNGISLPSREAQAELLRSIYTGNGIDVGKLAFVEGHGTGTKVGDPAELWSIGKEIGTRRSAPIPVGSIKSNIGHTEPASGVLGLMKAVLALEHNYVPASLHFERSSPDVDFDALNVRVATDPIELLKSNRPRLAGINSFGFGGANAHVVICDPQNAPAKSEHAPECNVFVASAQSRSALDRLLQDYRQALSSGARRDRQAIASAAGANRTLMKSRFVVASGESEEIVAAIDAHMAGRDGGAEVAEAPVAEARIAFVFSGNGSQWAGMGVDAFNNNLYFRQRFTAISALFQLGSDLSLTDLLFDDGLADRLADTKVAQPLLFAIQAALSDTLTKYGIRPSATFGHSVGEVAAAYASGAVPLVDAVAIVAKRSLHQDRLAGCGKMLAALVPADEAMELARAEGLNEICVGAYNAANSVTLTGPAEEIRRFREVARARKIPASILDIEYPFHHPMIDASREAFLADLTHVSLRPSEIDFISTVTGDVMEGTGLDSRYWWRNVREPVFFHAGVEKAVAMGCTVFVEIGPRPILSSYLKEAIKASAIAGAAVPTLTKDRAGEGSDPVARAFARVLAHGGAFHRNRCLGARNAFVDLPALPFERSEVRTARTTDAIELYGGAASAPYTLAGWRVDPLSNHWKNHLDAHLFPDLAEHVVDGKSILPGSGFMEMALSVARQFFGTEAVEIANLEITRPLELGTETITELSTVISPETGDIEIRSRERLTDDDWTLHAVARARPLKKEAPVELPRRGKVAAAAKVTGAEAYETARRFGLDYGERFRLLLSVEKWGERTLSVSLKAPGEPGNPYVGYGLHPISVDATFHGLVALFAEYSGSRHGAPYIPVRFGNIRSTRVGATVARAVIEIERVSEHSIKARFTLLDESDAVVATLGDCRFRRTYLRQRKTLDATAFHHEAVPMPVLAGRAMPGDRAVPVVPLADAAEVDETTLLLNAAVYRACYDIARRLAKDGGLLSVAALPDEPVLRRHLAYCMGVLEQVGFAESSDEGWTIAAECELPAVDEILVEATRGTSARAVEAVLINNAHRELLARIASRRSRDGEADHPAPIGDATRVHFEQHGAMATIRSAALVAALARLLDRVPGGVRVLEMGSVSPALTRRLAALARAAGGTLAVAEQRDSRRHALKIAFESDPLVDVIENDELAGAGAFDIVVSASNELYATLETGMQAGWKLEGCMAPDARFVGVFDAPNFVADFVFGLEEDWFAGSQDALFPIGRYGSGDDWTRLLDAAGLVGEDVRTVTTEAGEALVVERMRSARADARNTAEEDEAPAPAIALLAEAGADLAAFGALGAPTVLSGDEGADAEAIRKTVADALGRNVPLVYACGSTDGEGAARLVDSIASLALVAETLRERGDADGKERPVLAVLAPGGAPGPKANARSETSSVASGVWAFMRVLENEYSFIDTYLIDTGVSAGSSVAGDAVVAILAADGGEREWRVDPATGATAVLRAVQGPAPAAIARTRDFKAASIRQATTSQIGSVGWEERDIPAPGPEDVVVRVAATGLNFRDVMWAMGLLPEEALEDGFAGATIGMECSGHVEAVGVNVTDFKPGDPVMAIGPAAFSTHMVVKAAGVAPLPADVDPVAGATLPVAFLTAYYSLVELGRLRPGESVLIHGGAGGVGLAALQVARHVGARVFATAGTEEKRRYLSMLGAEAVFDSRSLDFADAVMKVTEGQGVDVVLNSLFGEAMELSLSLVKPFGRFLELGKRDFFADSKIGLRPFRRNISYFGIDADQLLTGRRELTAALFADIAALFAKGELTPLPYRRFAHDEVQDAFRLMQGSGHIGKIVVTPPVPGEDAVARRYPGRLRVDPDGMHLVVGGIGGFGLAAADWLVEKGARHVALCSRRGLTDAETDGAIARWKAKGVTAHVHACDVTKGDAVETLLATLREVAPLKSVIHAAMVLDDALISNLDRERNRPVIEVKARGADNLDRLTRSDALDNFILFSSATTLIGNPGQANYVAANGYLEGLARLRRQAGLPGLAVGFGAIADTGFLAANTDVGDLLAKRIGKTALKAREALDLVESYCQRDPATVEGGAVAVSEIDWAVARSLPIARTPFFETILRSADQSAFGAAGSEIDLKAIIEGKSPEEAEHALYELIAAEIASILRIPVESLSRNKVLKEVGLDSLMAIEVGLGFQKRTGYEMPLSGVSDTTTVGDIARKLHERIRENDPDSDDAAAKPSVVEALAERHVEARKAESGSA